MLGKSQVKYIQSLGHKKHRDQEQLFIAEGPKIVGELIAAMPERIRHIYHAGSPDFNIPVSIPHTVISADDLSRISQLQTPNQVLALVEQRYPEPPVLRPSTLYLALDAIRDPGNLGTIIRIADWFGISQVVCSHDSADVYNPKVVQSTMGSIARVDVCYTELREWLATIKGKSPIIAAALDGINVRDFGQADSGVLIIGNEGHGISDAVLGLVDQRVTIMGSGRAESLNAAVATGILLSHLM